MRGTIIQRHYSAWQGGWFYARVREEARVEVCSELATQADPRGKHEHGSAGLQTAREGCYNCGLAAARRHVYERRAGSPIIEGGDVPRHQTERFPLVWPERVAEPRGN
jgi:hypothetical protein